VAYGKMWSFALWQHMSISLHVVLSQHNAELFILHVHSEYSFLKLSSQSIFNLIMSRTTKLSTLKR